MNKTECLSSFDEIQQFKKAIKTISNYGDRNFLLLVIGSNTGLRISDILKIKIGDIKKYNFCVFEHKKNDYINISLECLKYEIDNYVKNKKDNEFVFKSRKGNNKSISRIQAWQIFDDVKKKLNIEKSIGTHFMRKTFATYLYFFTNNYDLVSKELNHKSNTSTKYYINMNFKKKDKKGFKL